MAPYKASFYADSAAEIDVASIVIKPIVARFKPSRIVDLGTGAGSWLAAARRHGVQTVHGLDGDWGAGHRVIDAEEFTTIDLEEGLPDLGRFDMAISTEVLEHISVPASERAVAWLCQAAPIVLFSAAIPGQGGHRHINEAWQSHWAKLFGRHGFKAYDIVRPLIWSDKRIPFWYRQNIVVMAHESVDVDAPPSDPNDLDLVHPELYTRKVEKLRSRSPKGVLRSIWRSFGG